MKKSRQHQATIIDYLQLYSKTSVKDFAGHLALTGGTTIRKDLIQLEEEVAVIRTYSGVALSREKGDQPIDHKVHINTVQQRLVAKHTALLIKNDESLIFDANNTVLQMVPWLAQYNNITVITNSLNIINELVELDNDQVILIHGNIYQKNFASFHGTLTAATFSCFNFDKSFISADGVNLTTSVNKFNELHAASQMTCLTAQQRILLIDSSKFSHKSLNIVCILSAVDIFITENGITPATRSRHCAIAVSKSL